MKQLKLKTISYDPTEPMLTIGFASKKVGVSPETLRLYEREGLLIPYKTSTGRRLFSTMDLEWIACIRRQIVNNRLNIAGIKRLLALIPCWDIKQCKKTDRDKCPAYLTNDRVCWELEETLDGCKNGDCRLCEVYQTASQIGHLKETFKVSVRK